MVLALPRKSPPPPRPVTSGPWSSRCPRRGGRDRRGSYGTCWPRSTRTWRRLPIEFLANGWDNAIFRLGEELLARMPRRALGAQIIAHEQRWLPAVAPRLPLPIPSPSRTGVPGLGFPYRWSVVPYLHGVAAVGTDGGQRPA